MTDKRDMREDAQTIVDAFADFWIHVAEVTFVLPFLRKLNRWLEHHWHKGKP